MNKKKSVSHLTLKTEGEDAEAEGDGRGGLARGDGFHPQLLVAPLASLMTFSDQCCAQFNSLLNFHS